MALSDSFSHSGILNVEHVFQLWWNRTKYRHFSWINCISKWCSLKRAASSLFWPHVMVVVVVLCFITTRDSFKGLCEHFFWQKSVRSAEMKHFWKVERLQLWSSHTKTSEHTFSLNGRLPHLKQLKKEKLLCGNRAKHYTFQINPIISTKYLLSFWNMHYIRTVLTPWKKKEKRKRFQVFTCRWEPHHQSSCTGAGTSSLLGLTCSLSTWPALRQP